MSEEVLPEGELVSGAFVEVGGDAVGVGEERARFAGAGEAEALAALGEPSFEVAAEGVGEEEIDVGVCVAEAAEVGEVAEAARGERENAVGELPLLEQREKLFLGDEGELGVGAAGAEGAEERGGHDDIAQPVGQADVDAGAAGEGGELRAELDGEEVAFGFQAEAAAGHVLVTPAVVGPQPGGAEVVVAAEEIFEPAVEGEDGGVAGVVVSDLVDGDFDAPEPEPARVDAVDAGGEFLGHQPGELGGGADAAEEGGEGALEAGVLVEEDADPAAAAEDFEGLGETVAPRKETHAEALAGGFDERVGGGIVEGAKNDAELGVRRGREEKLRGLSFPIGEMGRADERGGGVGVVSLVRGYETGRSGDDLAPAALGEVGRGEGEEAGFDEAAAALAGDGAVPVGGFFRESVVKVGEDEPAATRQGQDEAAEGGGEQAEEKLGGVRDEPTE